MERFSASTKKQEAPKSIFEQLPEHVDAVAVFGRGIERVGEQEEWRPTRIIQRLNEKGFRTGKREKDVNPDDLPGTVWVAGGNANTLALVHAYEHFRNRNNTPELVIISGGRPAYLEEQAPDEPHLAEAGPMKEVFERKTGETRVVTLEHGKNTKDDVVNTLHACLEKNLRTLVIINTEIAMDRTKALYEKVLEENPALSSVTVYFVTAEDALRDRYRDSKTATALFEKIQEELTSSNAWEHTRQKEQGGIDALKKDSYKGAGKY